MASLQSNIPVREVKVIAQPAAAVLIQRGPVYHCFLCGAPARGLAYWPTPARGASPLDSHAAHIAYLEPSCTCHQRQPGCTRVAVLEGRVTPLRFATHDDLPDFNDRTGYNVAAVLAALALLVEA